LRASFELPVKLGRVGGRGIVAGDAAVEDVEIPLHGVVDAAHFFQAFAAADPGFVAF